LGLQVFFMAKLNLRTELQQITDKPRLLHSGSDVPLADWLEVSWFYPQGFRKEKVVETDRSYIVIGQNVVYKFLKAAGGHTRGTFGERWQSACEEVLDNRELAPDLYLGLRMLRWIDDEPHWITELRCKDLLPESPPPDADDVVIVMRRIPAHSRLSRFVEDSREVSPMRISGLSKFLSKYYKHRRRAGIQECIEEPLLALSWVKERLLGRLEYFAATYGSFLDPFSRIAFQEAKAYLKAFYEENRQIFLMRGNSGQVIDCHSNLKSEHICIEPIGLAARTISVFGRLPRAAARRKADILSDIASLVIDLEARGVIHLAHEFEECFFSTNPEAYNKELYQFYLVSSAVSQAMDLLCAGCEESAVGATNLLALALRNVLGLRGPFVVAIGGPREDGAEDLASSIAEMTAAVSLDSSAATSAQSYSGELDELVFDKLLKVAKQRLRGNSSVVMIWPFNQEEERLRLVAMADSLGAPYVLVKCCLSRAERLNKALCQSLLASRPPDDSAIERRLWSKQHSPWPISELSKNLNQVYIEPVIPRPELALGVLQDLARISRS
jgi:aminoglycoside phosphotransferase family enzyme/predicted kinase